MRADDWDDAVHDLRVEGGVAEDEVAGCIELGNLVCDVVDSLSHRGWLWAPLVSWFGSFEWEIRVVVYCTSGVSRRSAAGITTTCAK